MVSIAVADRTAVRPHEILEDVWIGEEGNPWQAEGYTFVAGPVPDLLSAYLVESDDERTAKIVNAKFKWLRDGFSDELDEDDAPWQWNQIQARIDDPADPLRTADLFQVYDGLIAEVTKRPPTSQTASSRPRSQTRKAGEAKRKRSASTSGA